MENVRASRVRVGIGPDNGALSRRTLDPAPDHDRNIGNQ